MFILGASSNQARSVDMCFISMVRKEQSVPITLLSSWIGLVHSFCHNVLRVSTFTRGSVPTFRYIFTLLLFICKAQRIIPTGTSRRFERGDTFGGSSQLEKPGLQQFLEFGEV